MRSSHLLFRHHAGPERRGGEEGRGGGGQEAQGGQETGQEAGARDISQPSRRTRAGAPLPHLLSSHPPSRQFPPARRPGPAPLPQIVIERAVRNKRKCVTTIRGLDLYGYKLADAAKKFGKKFACGASVVKDATGKEEIDIQARAVPAPPPRAAVDSARVSAVSHIAVVARRLTLLRWARAGGFHGRVDRFPSAGVQGGSGRRRENRGQGGKVEHGGMRRRPPRRRLVSTAAAWRAAGAVQLVGQARVRVVMHRTLLATSRAGAAPLRSFSSAFL